MSTQRLGHKIDIYTTPRDGNESYHLQLQWDNFVDGINLQAVPVLFQKLPLQSQHGTKLVITDLNELDRWRSLGTEDLRLRLATIVSPYRKVENFKLYCTLNGTYIDIGVLVDNLRSASQQRYHLVYEDKTLQVHGLIRAETVAVIRKSFTRVFRKFL